MRAAPTTPALRGLDDRHELRRAKLLTLLFGPAVAAPAALHVDAKLCLVHRQPVMPRPCQPIRSAAWRCNAAMDDGGLRRFMKQPSRAMP